MQQQIIFAISIHLQKQEIIFKICVLSNHNSDNILLNHIEFLMSWDQEYHKELVGNTQRVIQGSRIVHELQFDDFDQYYQTFRVEANKELERSSEQREMPFVQLDNSKWHCFQEGKKFFNAIMTSEKTKLSDQVLLVAGERALIFFFYRSEQQPFQKKASIVYIDKLIWKFYAHGRRNMRQLIQFVYRGGYIQFLCASFPEFWVRPIKFEQIWSFFFGPKFQSHKFIFYEPLDQKTLKKILTNLNELVVRKSLSVFLELDGQLRHFRRFNPRTQRLIYAQSDGEQDEVRMKDLFAQINNFYRTNILQQSRYFSIYLFDLVSIIDLLELPIHILGEEQDPYFSSEEYKIVTLPLKTERSQAISFNNSKVTTIRKKNKTNRRKTI